MDDIAFTDLVSAVGVEPFYQDKWRAIFLGDCLEILPKLPDRCVDLVLCDLPYGVTARNEWDKIIPMKSLCPCWMSVIREDSPVVLTAIQPFSSFLVVSNPNLFKYEWIWEKQQGTGFLNAKKQPLRNHESVLVFYDKQPVYHPQFTSGKPYKQKSGRGSLNYRDQVSVITDNEGVRYPLSVQKFAYDGGKKHPTQKPEVLFSYLVKTYTDNDDIVLDNCLGSGTTALVAGQLNRYCIGIELEEKYCEIAANRCANDVVGRIRRGEY
jgi:site-specific DNA-methyltransferase (adenine-specific)